MTTANEKLYDDFLRHQTYLLRYSAGLRNRVLEILKKSNARTEEIAVSRLSDIKAIESPSDARKVNLALTKVKKEREKVWDEIKALMLVELRDLARDEPRFTANRVESVLPVKYEVKLPSARDVDKAVAVPVKGKTPRAWITTLKNDDISRVRGAIYESTSEGRPLKQALRSQFKTSGNNVDSTARTLTNHVASAARTETLKKNDELQQEQYIAVLDSRTTLRCATENGNVYTVGRGPIPPIHFGCRSIRISVMAQELLSYRQVKPETEEELVKDFAKENNLGNITKRSDLPFGYKGEFDEWAPQRVSGLIGGTPDVIEYGEWLKRQPDEFIVDTLGPTRAALFKDGNLKLDKFVNRSGDALTLDELMKRSPEAFNKI